MAYLVACIAGYVAGALTVTIVVLLDKRGTPTS